MNTRKYRLLQTLTSPSVATLIASNIITNKQTDLFGFAVTCGTFTIPVDYIVSDVLAEVYGFNEARRVTITAFLCDLLCVILFQPTLVSPSFSTFTHSLPSKPCLALPRASWLQASPPMS